MSHNLHLAEPAVLSLLLRPGTLKHNTGGQQPELGDKLGNLIIDETFKLEKVKFTSWDPNKSFEIRSGFVAANGGLNSVLKIRGRMKQ